MRFSGAQVQRRRLLARTIAVCLTISAISGSIFVETDFARAMVAIENGTGYPGDRVQVRVQNQQTGPPASWQITAPPNTSIVSAVGSNPGGTVPFSCTIAPSGASATCQTLPNTPWAAGNVVTLGLDISPNAPAGTYTGTSSFPWESGPYTVTVLPPPAPELTAPADGTRSLETRPVISGTKLAGHSVQALVDGAPACLVPADDATTWECTPTAPLVPGLHQITATQTSPGGSTGAVSAPRSYEVIQLAALSLAISPAEGRPGQRVPITTRLRNGGPGAAENPRVQLNFGTLTATDCRIDGQPIDCAVLTDGTDVPAIANGSSVEITATVQIPGSAADGQSFPIRGSASASNAESAPVRAVAPVRVREPVVTPPPAPRPPTPLVSRPPPAAAPPFAPPPVLRPALERRQTPREEKPRRKPVQDLSLPRASTPLPINFSTGLKPIAPGTARTFTGSIGPIEGSKPAEVVVSGRIDRGLWFRAVTLEPDGDCEITAREFSCTVVMKPGQVATLSARVYADAAMKARAANLQLTVDADPDQFDNLKTASIRIDNTEKASGLLGAAGGPIGLPAILLALFLLALAAHAERGSRAAADPDGGSS